jgi:Amidases related to nicotinamidase
MKHPYLLSQSNTALLIIDMQEKFREAVPSFNELVDNIARCVLTFQMFDMPILVTEQYPAGLGSTVDPIRKLFTFLEVIEKLELSVTENPHFWAQVNPLDIKTFVVCGIETHVCVNQTVLSLIERGMQVHVIADAVHSRHAFDHNIALRKMELAGAHITTTEMCLFELVEKAGTESFKNIQRMVRGKFVPGRLTGRPMGGPDLKKDLQGRHSEPAVPDEEPKQPFQQQPAPAQADPVFEVKAPPTPIAADASEASPAQEKSTDSQVDIAAVDEILESISNEAGVLTADSEKTESELDKDLGEIDSLLKNLENDIKKE